MKPLHRVKHVLLSACAAAAWLASLPGSAAMGSAGVDRYVTTTGSDTTNDCTSSLTPCLTVGHAISESLAGDTIQIAAGTYAETVSISTDLTLQGAGMNSTILDGAAFTVVSVGVATVLIRDLTVRDGNSAGNAGGIVNSGTLTLERLKITGNTGFSGGGIANYGTLTVLDSVISGNHAVGGTGGGVYNSGAVTATLKNVTLSGNTSAATGGIHAQGGASVNITNSTIQGSSGTGALVVTGGSSATVVNSTIAENTALTGAGILAFGTVTLTNTIVSGNSTSDCIVDSGATWTSGGHNLDSDSTCAFGAAGDISGSDPLLGPLGAYGGPTSTMPLLALSPAINAGDDAICAAVPVSGKDQRGVPRPQGTHCEIGAVEKEPSLTFRSTGAQDGWLLESTETSGKAGTWNSADTQFNLGDDAADKQYRGILSFDTSSLPDTAVVTSATLKIKKTAAVGASPFLSLGNIIADIKLGFFSGNAALQLTDFYAAGSRNYAGSIPNAPVGSWYSGAISQTYVNYVSLTGGTQFRLRFATDDNDNLIANYLRFASGDAIITSRPQLIITYYVP